MKTVVGKTNEVPMYQDFLTVLEQPLYQNILKIVSGKSKSGFVLFDSNSKKINEILNLCKRLEIPNEKIKVLDPTKPWSLKFQPFSAATLDSASNLRQTIDIILWKSEEFLKNTQTEFIYALTQLAILSFGPKTTITHVIRLFLEPRFLADTVENLYNQYNKKIEPTFHSHENIKHIEGLIEYFKHDVLVYKTIEMNPALYPREHKYAGRQIVVNKKESYLDGVKKLFNDFLNSKIMPNLFNYDDGKEIFNTELFIKEGGVLLVNSATTETENKEPPLFGQLFLTHFQNAVSRHTRECVITGIKSTPIIFYPCRML
ncbi:hypothetical protein [Lysinibacillus capsici]|uniref:hypothetical protein n=1 Tax=Lysinibacillus capsici TaxID=2115968 RepID=UPI003D05BE45